MPTDLRRVVARRSAAGLDDLGQIGIGDRQLVDSFAFPVQALDDEALRDRGPVEPSVEQFDRPDPAPCRDRDDLSLAFLVALGAVDGDEDALWLAENALDLQYRKLGTPHGQEHAEGDERSIRASFRPLPTFARRLSRVDEPADQSMSATCG